MLDGDCDRVSELRRKLILLAEGGALNPALALLGMPQSVSGVVDDELVTAVKQRLEERA